MFKTIKAIMLVAGFLLATSFSSAQDIPAGKTIFLDNKCNMCHTIAVLQIEKVSGKPSTEKGPPDLSTVGSKHEAIWISKFLLKEEVQNGKKHMKQFAGKQEDLKTLASWLESLKEKN